MATFKPKTLQSFNRAGAYAPNENYTANLTGVTGVVVFVSTASGGITNTPEVRIGGTLATYIGSTGAAGSTGKVFAFKMLSPPTGAAVTVNFQFPNQYIDQGAIAIVGYDNATDFGFFDAKAGGTTITLTGTTLKSGGGVLAYAHGHFVPTITMGASTPTGVESIHDNTTNSNHPVKLATLDYTGVGTTVSMPFSVSFNQINGCAIEVAGASGPPAQTVSPTGIQGTRGFGSHGVSRNGEKIVGPSGIAKTSALGSHTVSRQTLAVWDPTRKAADLTISGTPVTVAEKVASAATHSLTLGTVPIVNTEKKYFEVTVNALGATSAAAFGFTQNQSVSLTTQLGAFGSSGIGWDAGGNARQDNAGLSGRSLWAAGDVLMFAIDMANGWVFMGKNGTWQNAGNASQAVNFVNGDGKANNSTLTTSNPAYPVFDGHIVGDKITANFGRSAFAYTMPTGYSALDAAPVASPKTITMSGKASSVAFGATKFNHVLHGTGIATTAAFGTHVVKVIQSIKPSGLPSTAAFGSAKINHKLTVTGKASSAAFGTHKIGFSIKPSGIVSTAALGTTKVNHRIVMTGKATGVQMGVLVVKGSTIVQVAGKASSAVLGSFSVSRGPVTLGASAIASTSALGMPSVARGAVSIAASGIASTARFGAHKINFVVKTSGLAVGSALGSPLVKGKYALGPSGISSASALGLPAVLRGAVHVTFVGLPTSSALGSPNVTTGARTVSAPGIAASSSVGSPTLSTGKVTVSPSGKAPSSGLGMPLVSTGKATVAPAGIVSTARFGTQKLSSTLKGAGIAPLSALGTPKIAHRVQLVGLASTGGVGTAKVGQKFQVAGISSLARFGTHVLSPGKVTVTMTGLKSGGVGTPLILTGALVLVPVAIASTARFGTAALARGKVTVSPAGIAKTSATGTPFVTAGGAMVAPNGIPSTARYGAHALTAKVIVTMTGIAKLSALGLPAVKAVSQIAPAGIASAAALGMGKIGQTTYVMSIVGKRAFGAIQVQAGARVLAPAGIAPTSALGAPVLLKGQTLLRPSGIAPQAALGLAALSTGPVTVRPASIVTGGMGTPSVKQRIAAMGIDSTAAFGQLRIEVGAISLQAQGIASKAALGTHQVRRGGVSIAPVGIPRASAVGQPVVIRQEIIRLPGLPSGVAFGVSIIRTSGVQVEVPSIASGERFGLPYAFVGERPIGLPAYSFKVDGQVWRWKVPKSEAGGFFSVPTMQTFKFKVPRRAK